MKLIPAAALIALSLSTPVQAQLLDGEAIWGGNGGCGYWAGEEQPQDAMFLLFPDRVERIETTCTIDSIDTLATGALITGTCSGEGETWTTGWIARPGGPGGLTISPSDAPELAIDLMRCN